MASSVKGTRALWVLASLGIAAIVATVGLLLSIKHRAVAQHRAAGIQANVRYAEQCAELLSSGALLARLRALADRRPNIASLLEIRDEIRGEFSDATVNRLTHDEFFILVVDDKLQPVWPPAAEAGRDLRACARHILDGEEKVFVLPHDCLQRGEAPACLCFTAPVQRDGVLIGGLVVHRMLASPGRLFTSLDRQMTRALIFAQAVLLVVLAAIALSARKAIARAEQERAKDARLVALGSLAAGVAHEIRTPLNTIALTCRYIERLIAKGSTDPSLRAESHTSFEIIASELARLSRALDDVVMLARPSELDARPCDLACVLDDTLALFARELQEAHIQLARHGSGPLPINGDPDRLSRVFANIVRNSVQAMRDGGTLTVTAEATGGQARVAFADTGPGIPAADLARIFEPYFTTKRSGLGLGLALSLRIVEAHGGTLSVANQPAGGAIVTVQLPIRPEPREAAHGK